MRDGRGRGHGNENDFCVKLKPLLEILRPLPGNEGIQLFRAKGKSDIELKTLSCEAHHYKLKTLEDSYYREALESCETTYYVDFDLANLKADTLKIQIYMYICPVPLTVRGTGGRRQPNADRLRRLDGTPRDRVGRIWSKRVLCRSATRGGRRHRHR